MLSLPQLKSLIKGNAVLSAAEKAGDIKLVYPKKPAISEDRLYGVYTLEVLLVEKDEADLVEAALRRGGFEFKSSKNGWIASYSFPLTPKDREAMEKADKAAKEEQQAVKLAKKDSEIQAAIAELRQGLQEVKEDQNLQGLLKPKAGAQGPAGPRGPAGPPGKDAQSQDFKLGDLSNVSDEEPREGFVLTYREGSWQPKAPRVGGGGGGGGGIPDAPQDGKQYVRKDGAWVEASEVDDACTDGGDACDHDPQTATVDGSDACLADPQATQLDAGYGCSPCLEEIEGGGTGTVEEAPQDGQIYGRKDGEWVLAIQEAPIDDKSYVRRNGEWEEAAETIGADQIQELQDQVNTLTELVNNLLNSGNVSGECGVLLEHCIDEPEDFQFEDGTTMLLEDGITRVQTENRLD